MEKTYTLKHLGIFSRPLLTIRDDGFHFKGKLYTHKDITRITIAGGHGQPLRMNIKLNDGKRIFVNASALELNGAKGKTGFFSGNNKVFAELKSYFEEAHS